MVTDDERRLVAEALRGMHDYETAIPIVRTCLGLRRGEIMDPEVRRRMSDRIADLIDPGDMSHGCRDTVACDRDALLALAGELDSSASMLLKQNDLDPNRKRRGMRRDHALSLMAASGCIREALVAVE